MPDREEFLKLLSARLTKYRLEHSINVADSARYLAKKYNAGEEKAYVAGLLHDIMKDAGRDEQLRVIEKAGYRLTPLEQLSPKLWHAVAGAAFVKTELNIDDGEITDAIRFHTTGKAGMGLLSKVIFIADYISADRTYEGIDKMRALSEQSLEDAMLFGLEFTIISLAGRGGLIHPDSISCYNELTANKIMKGNG
jgi:predicted HD superfamily hydrolase involved in NAD metabolism